MLYALQCMPLHVMVRTAQAGGVWSLERGRTPTARRARLPSWLPFLHCPGFVAFSHRSHFLLTCARMGFEISDVTLLLVSGVSGALYGAHALVATRNMHDTYMSKASIGGRDRGDGGR